MMANSSTDEDNKWGRRIPLDTALDHTVVQEEYSCSPWSNDHFAHIYDSIEERVDIAASFIYDGLNENELCLIIGDGEFIESLAKTLVNFGVDFESAEHAGLLERYSYDETYLKDGQFRREQMIEFYAEQLEHRLRNFDGVRIVAGTSWINSNEVDIDCFMQYESQVNEVFNGSPCQVICQYDRTDLPPVIIRDIIRTHPNLVINTRFCYNPYYVPLDELIHDADPVAQAERMLLAIQDLTSSKSRLWKREHALRRLTEITTDTERSFEEKLHALFELGCGLFEFEMGAMARVDIETNWFKVEIASDNHLQIEPGLELPLSETFCTVVTETNGVGGVATASSEGYDETILSEEFGAHAYLGTYLEIEGSSDRTFFFISSRSREEPFSEADQTFIRLMGQWIQSELGQLQAKQELERTIDRLENSNEHLEQSAYAATHDIKQPLRSVISYLQLLKRRTDGELSPDNLEYLEIAVESAERMSNLIEGFHEFTCLETDTRIPEPVDLHEIVREICDSMTSRIVNKGITVTVGSLPTVVGDRNQLHQLFQNLISNAIKYAGDIESSVIIDAHSSGTEWVISIEDNGIGIPERDIDHIFDIFHRSHHSNSFEGAGIGLAICKRVVEGHGGDIWVESIEYEGSKFSFSLPFDGSPEL